MTVLDRDVLHSDRRGLLSTLWVFLLLNVLFRDVHELFRPTLLEQMIAGTVNGTPVTEATILLGGVTIEVPLLMVVLSRVLVPSAARLLNAVVAVVTVPVLLLGGVRDLDDAFFAAVTVATALAVAVLAWTWRTGAPVAGPLPTGTTTP